MRVGVVSEFGVTEVEYPECVRIEAIQYAAVTNPLWIGDVFILVDDIPFMRVARDGMVMGIGTCLNDAALRARIAERYNIKGHENDAILWLWECIKDVEAVNKVSKNVFSWWAARRDRRERTGWVTVDENGKLGFAKA